MKVHKMDERDVRLVRSHTYWNRTSDSLNCDDDRYTNILWNQFEYIFTSNNNNNDTWFDTNIEHLQLIYGATS